MSLGPVVPGGGWGDGVGACLRRVGCVEPTVGAWAQGWVLGVAGLVGGPLWTVVTAKTPLHSPEKEGGQ